MSYCQEKFNQFIDFKLFEGYEKLLQQLEDDEILAFGIEYTPLQQFVNSYINKQITEQFLLEENLEMIKKVFLGFQSDFVTNYC